MSQHKLIRQSFNKNQQNQQQQYDNQPIISVNQPKYIQEIEIENQLSKIYTPLTLFQCCGGNYQQFKMEQFLKKKRQNLPQEQISEESKLLSYDGAYQENVNIDTNSQQINRQKMRSVRDQRQQLFHQNGQFLIEKQFFQQQLARLANISYDQNHSIRTFHKNAILSERNNQKKNVSFQLIINFGDIWFNRHSLQNQQQKKFQQIRPLIKQWTHYSTYPTLPELKKQIQFLQAEKFAKSNSAVKVQKDQVLEQLQNKIKTCEEFYNKQRLRIQQLLNKIMQGWKQIKRIRRQTGMQTVPHKIQVKQQRIQNGKRSYDIGISQIQTPQIKAHRPQDAEKEKNRREQIKKQKYFLKVYINDNQVAKTQKAFLQWPSFKVSLNQQVNITVYSAPYKITVQVIKSSLINQVVETVNLSLPGINAKTISASQKKITYASFPPNQKQVKNGKEQFKVPSGMIFYTIEWKGQGSRMPPSIITKSMQEQTACTQASQTQLTDLKQNIDELFDIKDPRKQQSRSIKLRIKEQNREKESEFPFAKIYSTRLLLLKMRNRNPQLQNLMIPLQEQEVRKRPDLIQIIDKEKNRNQPTQNKDNLKYFHPLINDFFTEQSPNIKNQIKNILQHIQNLKVVSNRSNKINLKYKISQQIINQHIFEQMESPIVVFLKNIFTQKRKLGPKNIYKAQSRHPTSDIEVNFHIRSARNLPIRENSQQNIKAYLQEQTRLNTMNQMMGMGMGMGMGGYNGMQNMYPPNQAFQSYGMGLYNQRPTINMTGHTFYHPNMGNPNRLNQQISYDSKNGLERVNTHVELRFKKNVKKTSNFQGPFPEWNQTLNFNYNLKTQNSSVQKIFYNNEKTMKLLVFDITESSKPTLAMANISIKKSKYYLGRIQIPFSLITIIPSLTGLYKLQRPLVVFSYTMKKQALFNNENEPIQFNLDVPTYLNIDMFSVPQIDPLLAFNNDRKFIPGLQNPLILQKASDWLQDLNTKRFVKLWLNNLQQKSIFISRYLSDNICPPYSENDYQQNRKIIQRCAKFVSLIPRKYNCKLIQNTQEFHLKTDQILKLKMGQDHGILLCNYFNYISKNIMVNPNIQSYLVIGKAFPYGKSIFVMRRDKLTNNCQIWDPFKGECYFFPGKQQQTSCLCFTYKTKKINQPTSRDICPMFEVTCIISKDNVYVNQQQETDPYLIEFDLQNNSNWIPFLTARTYGQYFEPGKRFTIQNDITPQFYKEYPAYQPLNQQIQKDLKNYIESKIEQKRKKLSTTYLTHFESKVSNKINTLLILCENMRNDFRMSGRDSTLYDRDQQSYQVALRKLQEQKNTIKNLVDPDKNLYGFTLNFTFTTKQQIWQKIQQTQIHLQQNNSMKFVLNVKCFEHPCHLFSVWIFIGTII